MCNEKTSVALQRDTCPNNNKERLVREEAGLSRLQVNKWKARSVRFRDRLRMPIGAEPWSSGQGCGGVPPAYRGVPANAARVKDVVDVGWFRARAEAPAGETAQETRKNLFINVSQNVDRIKAKTGFGTLCRNSTMYSYEFDCVASGAVHMQTMGWPAAMLPIQSGDVGFSEHALRDLCGDSVSLPLTAVIEGAFYYNPAAPWWRRPRDGSAAARPRR